MTHTPTKKCAIITGASRGIGRAAALRLARDGFAIVVNYAGNATIAEEVVADINTSSRDSGSTAIAVQADVANEAEVERLFNEASNTFGEINAVVNSAGIMPLSPINNGDLEIFDKVIKTNLRGTFIVLTGSQKNFFGRKDHCIFQQRHLHGISELRTIYSLKSRRRGSSPRACQ